MWILYCRQNVSITRFQKDELFFLLFIFKRMRPKHKCSLLIGIIANTRLKSVRSERMNTDYTLASMNIHTLNVRNINAKAPSQNWSHEYEIRNSNLVLVQPNIRCVCFDVFRCCCWFIFCFGFSLATEYFDILTYPYVCIQAK